MPEYLKTQARLRAEFWRDIAPGIPANDKPALREAFNTWTDGLHRDGLLTDYQVDRITLGKETAPKAPRHDTARAMRRDNRPVTLPLWLLHDAIACIARAEVEGAFKGCAAPNIGRATLHNLEKIKES